MTTYVASFSKQRSPFPLIDFAMSSLCDRAKSAYLKVFDCLHPKTYVGRAGYICGFIATVVGAYYLFRYAFIQVPIRDLLLLFFGVVILATVANTIEKRYQLRRQPKAEPKTKLRAELFAGCALLTFAGQFFNLGSALERVFPDPRSAQLIGIVRDIDSLSRCTKLSTVLLCKTIDDLADDLKNSLKERSEDDVSNYIEKLKMQLISREFAGFSKAAPQRINDVITALNTLNRPGYFLAEIVQMLPILSFFFASLAVSSKVALAWPMKKDKDADHQGAPLEKQQNVGTQAVGRVNAESVASVPCSTQRDVVNDVAKTVGTVALIGVVLGAALAFTATRDAHKD